MMRCPRYLAKRAEAALMKLEPRHRAHVRDRLDAAKCAQVAIQPGGRCSICGWEAPPPEPKPPDLGRTRPERSGYMRKAGEIREPGGGGEAQ